MVFDNMGMKARSGDPVPWRQTLTSFVKPMRRRRIKILANRTTPPDASMS